MFKNIIKIILLLLAFDITTSVMPGHECVTVYARTNLTSKTEKIVKKNTKPSDSEKKKLKKLFKYVEKKYGYKRVTGFETYNGWAGDYAIEMYTEKKGSCYHFAAAYAFLAEKATGYKVRIGVGKTNGFSGDLQNHAWTEVKINSKWYICDTNMDKYAENSSGKYFLKSRNKLKKVYNNYKDVKYFMTGF